MTVEKCAPGASGSNVYYLRRLRSYCPKNHDVRRLMAFIYGQLNIAACNVPPNMYVVSIPKACEPKKSLVPTFFLCGCKSFESQSNHALP